ncbi:unnamed protein product [Aureobasidium uvarum]|uniref:Protein kinase domain-containing protein n=1 Tax=Aureobasidium uvarum TaxID=2773716 RepID=A0A9N8KFP7_9PEZI|nr:unnamed protein product [Aureobasidium uvarum]
MSLIIQSPFPSLSTNNFVSQGSAGQVFAITRNIAFKCPILFKEVNLGPDDKVWMQQNVKRLENEKRIYRLLSSHPHPHLLQAILCTREGIFMPRLDTTLAIRLRTQTSPDLQERWIQQLVSAVAWLEELGHAHGDLRPHNIFLDQSSNIVVGDFDATVPFGAELQLSTLPFCKVDEDFETPRAGAETEQFSLGSCIYNIRFGFAPFSDLGLESPVWRKRLVRKEFPSTEGDVYGSIIQSCWYGVYPSIRALQDELLKISDPRLTAERGLTRARRTSWLHSWFLLAQCREWVAGQRLCLAPGFAGKIWLRYQLTLWSIARFGLGCAVW